MFVACPVFRLQAEVKTQSLSHLKPSHVVGSLLEDHEAVELAAAGIHEGVVLEEEKAAGPCSSQDLLGDRSADTCSP